MFMVRKPLPLSPMSLQQSPINLSQQDTDSSDFTITYKEEDAELLLFMMGVAVGAGGKYDEPGPDVMKLSSRMSSLSARTHLAVQQRKDELRRMRELREIESLTVPGFSQDTPPVTLAQAAHAAKKEVKRIKRANGAIKPKR